MTRFWQKLSLKSRFYLLLLYCIIACFLYGYIALLAQEDIIPLDAIKLRMTGTMIAMIVVGLWVAAKLSKSAVQAMSDIYDCLNQINDHHDWNMRLKVHGNDEFSQLADQLNYLFANMELLDIKIRAKTINLEEINQQLRSEMAARKEIEDQLENKTIAQAQLILRLETTQSQLAQAEKMASIGQLAAGVAHEINNPIGFVNSNLNSLERYTQSLISALAEYATLETINPAISSEIIKRYDLEFISEDLVCLINESADGLNRVKGIVQDLKDFSHIDSGEWTAVNINKSIDSTINMARNEIKYKAEIVLEYSTLPDTEIIGSQFNQVILNLLVNAAQSIEKFGKITITTLLNNNHIIIKIRDTGTGISPENMNRIFDPFFTTKPVGKGTGLGLSLAFSLMQKMHGKINAESEVNKGSCFTLEIPLNARELSLTEESPQ